MVFLFLGILNFSKNVPGGLLFLRDFELSQERAEIVDILHWRASRRQKGTALLPRGLKYFPEIGLKGSYRSKGSCLFEFEFEWTYRLMKDVPCGTELMHLVILPLLGPVGPQSGYLIGLSPGCQFGFEMCLCRF